MDTLKQLLYDEGQYKMADELLDDFLDAMTEEIHLKNNEPLIPYGKFDNNVYVLSSGIVRVCYFDGDKEKTFGFASPGTIIISYHSFFMRQPSFFQFESCGESVVMKVSKKDFDALIDRSHDFTKWILSLSSGQLYINEYKYSVINGLAKERFVALMKNRPEIMARVPLKTIASYLGVTPAYLSRLKKTFQKK